MDALIDDLSIHKDKDLPGRSLYPERHHPNCPIAVPACMIFSRLDESIPRFSNGSTLVWSHLQCSL